MNKRMLQSDSPHRIGRDILFQIVLIVVGHKFAQCVGVVPAKFGTFSLVAPAPAVLRGNRWHRWIQLVR
jgi:hypothetical protein